MPWGTASGWTWSAGEGGRRAAARLASALAAVRAADATAAAGEKRGGWVGGREEGEEKSERKMEKEVTAKFSRWVSPPPLFFGVPPAIPFSRPSEPSSATQSARAATPVHICVGAEEEGGGGLGLARGARAPFPSKQNREMRLVCWAAAKLRPWGLPASLARLPSLVQSSVNRPT